VKAAKAAKAAKVGNQAKKYSDLNNDITTSQIILRMMMRTMNPNIEILRRKIAAMKARQLRLATKLVKKNLRSFLP
jgi:hypothetical protein